MGTGDLIKKLTAKAKMSNEYPELADEEDDTLPTNIYSASETGGVDVQLLQNERNVRFMYFLLFIEILLNISQSDKTAKQDFIEYCKKAFQDNKRELKKIQEFEDDYIAEHAINWYTKESFFYRVLNNAIRLQDFDVLLSLRLCIIDLYSQLQKEHQNFLRSYIGDPVLCVFRGQRIHINELNLIRKNIGKLLSMNTFLSTSLTRSIALKFAKTNKRTSELQQIIYQFNINTSLRKTAPYTNISDFSDFSHERELLIAAGSIFRIEEVCYDEHDDVWFGRLSLCERDDFELTKIMNRVKEDVGDGFLGLSYLLAHQGKFDKAREYFQQRIADSSISYFDAGQCFRGLGAVAFFEDNYEDALAYYQKALKLTQKAKLNDNELIGSMHRCIAEVYLWMGDLDLAFDHATEAKSLLVNNTLEMATVYSVIGNIHRQRGETYDAMDYYQNVLDIRTHHLPPDHSDIGIIYNSIGAHYTDIGEYELAHKAFSKSLSIKQRTLPSNHPSIQQTMSNIEVIQQKLHKDNE